MTDEPYEFLCQGCDDLVNIFLNRSDLDKPRPFCSLCGTPFLINIASLRTLPSFRQYDRTYTAKDFSLTNTYTQPIVEVSSHTVIRYADMMETGRWVDATEDAGGPHVPILFIDGKLLLGVQRMMAVVQSNASFTNTTIEVD